MNTTVLRRSVLFVGGAVVLVYLVRRAGAETLAGYLQNIGTPFELWLTGVSELADRQQTPTEFLRSATRALLSLPWFTNCCRHWQGHFQPHCRGLGSAICQL